MSNLICLSYNSNVYYIDCFENDTIGDATNILSKKYHFVDDENLKIYQNFKELPPGQKIKELEKKNNLYVKGSIKSNEPKENNSQNEDLAETDFISMFRDMRFDDSDEKINELLVKNENKVEAVISTLLLNKKRKKIKFLM